MKAEIKNIDLEIEQMEYVGCAGISYEEKAAPTNNFNSSVENEIVNRERRIAILNQSKRETLMKLNKIDNALEILEPRDLEIIKLRYFSNINNRNISIRLDLTEEWICTLKASAVNKLSTLINIQ